MTIDIRPAASTGQPYVYRHRALVEPDWTRFPGWKDVTEEEWRSAQWQRSHCVKNVGQLRTLMGDLLTEDFYADLERDQTERATMSMLVPPQMLNTMVPAGMGRRLGRDHARVLRRPGPALHAPGVLRPPHRLALPPARHPRLPPRARHVGRRGSHPPLPHQGPGRAAADLPAVLRPLHPHGPGRQLHRHVRQAEVRPQAGRPLRRDDRLPARPPRGPRRGGLRWRRREPSLAAPAGLRLPAARAGEHPRHPAGHQGADGPAPALAAGRGRQRHGRAGHHRAGARRLPGDPHPRQPRELGDPAGRRGGEGDAARWACATCATRACCSTA